jgi:hypothetical protein
MAANFDVTRYAALLAKFSKRVDVPPPPASAPPTDDDDDIPISSLLPRRAGAAPSAAASAASISQSVELPCADTTTAR